jgi:hypothetical protein
VGGGSRGRVDGAGHRRLAMTLSEDVFAPDPAAPIAAAAAGLPDGRPTRRAPSRQGSGTSLCGPGGGARADRADQRSVSPTGQRDGGSAAARGGDARQAAAGRERGLAGRLERQQVPGGGGGFSLQPLQPSPLVGPSSNLANMRSLAAMAADGSSDSDSGSPAICGQVHTAALARTAGPCNRD